ncbi:hypothetical protein AOQ84DRAFT_362257 [Glonium stellatum]|uniref:Uncharacterized protein n=1 Tax=Glonium stellatum TaxID=574774 RepID=A0A8E2JVD1_9PEZI|nr:hypothetical protein AOQ84DRAFT_362257 [Glonium stellatum]
MLLAGGNHFNNIRQLRDDDDTRLKRVCDALKMCMKDYRLRILMEDTNGQQSLWRLDPKPGRIHFLETESPISLRDLLIGSAKMAPREKPPSSAKDWTRRTYHYFTSQIMSQISCDCISQHDLKPQREKLDRLAQGSSMRSPSKTGGTPNNSQDYYWLPEGRKVTLEDAEVRSGLYSNVILPLEKELEYML